MEKTTMMGDPARPLESTAPGPVPVVELPRRHEVSPTLNRIAEQLGRACGIAEVQLRQLPGRFRALRERVRETRNRTSQNATTAAEWKQSAQQGAYQARTRAQYLANEYPVETIAGVAGAAFVTGFALRLWRANHARYE